MPSQGFQQDQYYPPPMDAWGKIKLGWVTPQVITPSDDPYIIAPQCQTNTVFKITANFPSGEYILVENRQKSCLYDSKMGGSYSGGLAIYHIDENHPDGYKEGYPGQSGWPANGNHYKVALLQADKLFELEKNANRGNNGDLFHDGDYLGPSTSSLGPYPNTDSYAFGRGIQKTNITLSDIKTLPGGSMSFRFMILESISKTTVKPTTYTKPSLKLTVKPTIKPAPTPNDNPSAKTPNGSTRLAMSGVIVRSTLYVLLLCAYLWS
jgi:hypothetical protein